MQISDRKKEELIFLAGHELKNPLSAFSLQTRVLKEMIIRESFHSDKEEILHLVNQSEKQVIRMENLLNRFIFIFENNIED